MEGKDDLTYWNARVPISVRGEKPRKKKKFSGGSEMKKVYREAIIGGIGGGILGTVLLYLIQGKVAWAYLFTYPIFTFIFHLYLKRREAKKEEEVQRRE